MWKWEEGARGAVEKKKMEYRISPSQAFFKKSLSLRFLCIKTDSLFTWQDWAHCGLMTGMSLYGKSKGKTQFCARTTERSLASSTQERRHTIPELKHFPRAILHHVLQKGGVSNITTLCCTFSSLLETPDVPRSAPSQPCPCLTEQGAQLLSEGHTGPSFYQEWI